MNPFRKTRSILRGAIPNSGSELGPNHSAKAPLLDGDTFPWTGGKSTDDPVYSGAGRSIHTIMAAPVEILARRFQYLSTAAPGASGALFPSYRTRCHNGAGCLVSPVDVP